MEEDKVITWYRGTPLMVYRSVADQLGLTNGSQINESALYEQVMEQNTNLSRAVCSINAATTGEVCGTCSS